MQEQITKKTKGKFLPKPNKRKKGLIIGAVAAAAAGLALSAVLFLGDAKEAPQLDLADTTILSYTDLQSTISASGTVESQNRTMVYSMVSYPVMAVHVEVGDQVTEGTLLAELDDQSIRNQINTQQINLDLSSQSSAQQVETARDNYDNFKTGLDQGLNSSLNSAKAQAETAWDNYVKAQTVYERYAESLDIGENTTLLNAEAALENAWNAVVTAENTYDQLADGYLDAKAAVQELDAQWNDLSAESEDCQNQLNAIGSEIDAVTAQLAQLSGVPDADSQQIADLEAQLSQLEEEREALTSTYTRTELELLVIRSSFEDAQAALTELEIQLDSAEQALTRAETAYNTQCATYNATVTTVDNTLADYWTNVETARKAYDNALTALAATEKSMQDQLETYQNSLSSAQISANKAASEEALRQLEENLQDTRITAPCTGTVTAVYAEVGGTGSGLLFVIEDVNNLMVETSVKGYDVGTVQEGTPVAIRSDATGGAEIEGVLTSIAPTSNKNALGLSDTTGEAVFAAEVAVTSKDTGLRIGMEAQLDYIIAEADHVLAVPYDAVYTDEQGQTCILAALEQEDGRYLIVSYPVTTGMDDDLDMVVSGPDLREGLRVINEADAYLDLLGQTVIAGTGLHSDIVSAMMGG